MVGYDLSLLALNCQRALTEVLVNLSTLVTTSLTQEYTFLQLLGR